MDLDEILCVDDDSLQVWQFDPQNLSMVGALIVTLCILLAILSSEVIALVACEFDRSGVDVRVDLVLSICAHIHTYTYIYM